MHVKSFPPFKLDTLNHCLWRSEAEGNDIRVPLTPKSYDLLNYLLDNADRLVTHEELLEALWTNVFVQPEVLKGHVRALRAALGDDADNPRFVQTLRGHGYRFIAPLRGAPPASAEHSVHAEIPPQFVARSIPLAELRSDFDRALRGSAQVALVSGESGIGKTALTQEFLRRTAAASNVGVAASQCVEGFGGTEAYYPILDALTKLCNDSDGNTIIQQISSLAPTWAMQMPSQVSAERRQALQRQIAGAGRDRMLREGCELFEALASTKPLILILEDAHWADYSTVDFISAFARRRSKARLMMIVTTRLEEAAQTRHPIRSLFRELNAQKLCKEIALERLGLDAIAMMIAKPGHTADLALTRLVFEQSGGNPLYAESLLEHLIGRGVVTATANGWELSEARGNVPLEVPSNIEMVVESGIERLPSPHRQALEAASVDGVEFISMAVAPTAGLDAVAFEDICEELSRNDSYVRRSELDADNDFRLGGRFEFRHGIHRQIFYDRQGPLRRARSHEMIALELERLYASRLGELAPRIEEHFTKAGVWSKAIVYNRMSLMTARQRFAYQDALVIFDRAKRLVARLPPPDRIGAEIEFLEMEAATSAALHDPRACEVYAQMIEKAASTELVDAHARALLGLAYTVSWRDPPASLKLLDEALSLSARQTDAQLRAGTQVSGYVWRMWVNRWDAEEMLVCDSAVAVLLDAGNALAAAWPMIEYSLVQFVSSHYREARSTVESHFKVLLSSVDMHPELNTAHAIWMYHAVSPCASTMLGDFGAAIQAFDAGIETFAKNGNDYGFRTLQLFRAWFLVLTLDFENVLEVSRSISLSLAQPAEQRLRLRLLLVGMAQAGLGHTADAAIALINVEHMMETQPAVFDWYWRMPLEWSLVNVALMSDDLEEAHRRSSRLIELTGRTAERTWQSIAWETKARVLLSEGALIEAVSCLDRARQIIHGFEAPLAEWRILSTAAATHSRLGEHAFAAKYSELRRLILQRLLGSLPQQHWLRRSLLRKSQMEPLLNAEVVPNSAA
jgi:DNA-binding winged helix-turn-helix (wHTH) protein/tetratricopeptide (TPR) repeat protein